MSGGTDLLTVDASLPAPDPDLHYLHYPMDVPEGCAEIELVLEYDKIMDVVQIYAVLLEPDGTFRGHVQCPGGPGPRRLTIGIGTATATPGCVPGPIPAGRWTVRLDLDRHKLPAPYRLTVTATRGTGTPGGPAREIGPVPAEPTGGPGWYRGELHSHSIHSDGRRPVGDLVAAARAAGLDFLAVTDHFTASHWQDLPDHEDDGIVLLHSMELTSHRGHANLHGLSRWVDTYVDRPGHTMTDVAADVHAQGGLVCVNHAFSGDQSWRRFETDWRDVDLIEVFHLQQGSNNDAQVGLWDRLLTAGHRVIGVAGSDCHDPHDPGQALGQAITVVHAEEGTERGIVEGLRAGRVWLRRGADLDMRVHGAPMGATVSVPGGEVLLEADVRAEEPVVLFVIRDGLLQAVLPVEEKPGEWQRLTLADRITAPGYYRVEVHADPGRHDPQFWASCLRDHGSLRAAGNPVWVRPS
ncbi:CehA/McbA family metallohydrolase [Streptosporangium sp. KLBMP 9127]|nr:CehA/McbA family metallohydrolase [Streptosporangium sp. KLBMP 9127]